MKSSCKVFILLGLNLIGAATLWMAPDKIGGSTGIFLTLSASIGLAILILFQQRKLQQTGNALLNFKEGDFTTRLPEKGNDEITGLNQEINALAEFICANFSQISAGQKDINHIVDDLIDSSARVSKNTSSMESGVQSSATAINQLNTRIFDINNNSKSIGTELGAVAVATEEMNASFSEVAHNTTIVADMVTSIRNNANNSLAQAERLLKSSDSISSVLEVINGIAGKIDLLALNATIEAASAGDAGKGFAVVANEIKELARRTSEATENIESKLKDLQVDSSKAAEAARTIGHQVDELDTQASGIAAASEEQATTSRDVASSVSSANNSVQEIINRIHEINQASTMVIKCQEYVQQSVSLSREAALESSHGQTKIALLINQSIMQLGGLTFNNKAFCANVVKAAHSTWKIRLNALLLGCGKIDLKEVTSHRNCQFGQWYFSEGKNKFGEINIFSDIDPVHEKIH
ncbi:MAG: CZB domain-containing protein, partial [Planctomycetes bacterium]|nr:CZB domain-containing protein [Planctomycetota bacterium]